MGTKNNPGAFDCYAAAEPDEPMFVLLGRDPHAPVLVELWAILRAKAGEDEEKVAEALACSDAMARYSLTLGKPPARSGDFDPVFLALTKGMEEHPEDFDGPCDCDLCRSCG